MATRSFNADDRGGAGLLSADASQTHRYRLTVVAADMVDAVSSAGGWLCDRARAGWDVTVLVAGHEDARPIAILGATALGFDAAGATVLALASQGVELAVTANVLTVDERVRADMLALLKKGGTAVTVWGEKWPAGFGGSTESTEHRLSSAARAFKAHALEAATPEPEPVAATETCFDLGVNAFRPLYPV
jgi:hypothetical protein